MLFPDKSREYFENLEELSSLQNPVKYLRLQNKLAKQNFHEIVKKYLNHLLIQLKTPLKS